MFTGFTQDALDFLSELRFNNNQQFFDANKARYEEKVKKPLRALCEEMGPVVSLIDPRLDLRPGSAMSRIRRDTRFTRDKSPFRDHVWLGWRYPGERRSEGFSMYWGFGPDWLGWGCGSYSVDKPLMDALRLHIRKHPDEVRAAVNAPDFAGRFRLTGSDYKKIKVPADVPEDLLGLYTKRGFDYEAVTTQDDWQMLFSHAMADRLTRDLAAMAPLHQLMQRMRTMADAAQEQTAREIEAQRRQAESGAEKIVAARSAEEFEF